MKSKVCGKVSGVASAVGAADIGALMPPEEAARFLGFKEGWLAKLRMTGGGPKFVKLGRLVRYRRADLEAWIASHVVASTSERSKAQREGCAA